MNGTTLTLGAIATLAVGAALRGRGSANAPFDYGTFAEAFHLWYAEHDWANEPDEERAFRRWALTHGAKYLGAGAQRIVFSVPGGALKVAFDRDGEMSNSTETEVWEDAPESIRRHLVPVLAGEAEGGTPWILMEQVRSTGKGRMSEETRRILNDCGIQDLTTQNLADDGRLFDYGWLYRDEWDACVASGSRSLARLPVYPGPTLSTHASSAELAEAYLALRAAIPDLILLRVLYAFAEADLDGLPHPGPDAFRAPQYFPAPTSMAANLQAGRFPLTRNLLLAMPGAWAAAVPFAKTLQGQGKKRAAADAKREAADAVYEAQGVVLEPHAMPRPATLRGRDVWLYHGTASTMLPRILRDGLVPGRDATPPRKRLVGIKSNVSNRGDTLRYQPHVFLTADDGNGAGTASWYAKQAAQHHGGDPVVLRVLVPYDELEPDPDDQDIRSGRHQFVIRQVSPDAIREVDGVRRRLTNRRRK